MVMPSTPSSVNTSFTASNLDGWIIASSLVIVSSHIALCPARGRKVSSRAGSARCPLACAGAWQRLHRNTSLWRQRWKLLRGSAGCAQSRNDVFGISGNPVLVKIEPIGLAFLRDAQQASRVHRQHNSHGNGKGSEGDGGAANGLGHEHLRATSVEQTFKRGGVIGSNRPSGSVFTTSEEAE